ncbi:MAG: 16S rRNA (cytosine(1402)-N(4))-methyltransferase RsmH, partial [Armatimonadota bacterium]|nr:16S rRNA (cytosine(1402)-N(4))-methyltransferase RsmH [Armatimonadota bacterium]
MPVLCAQAVEFIQPRSGGVYVDATLGGGGHAEAILEASAPDGVLIGIDRDPEALTAARQHLQRFGKRLRTVHATFDLMHEVARQEGFAAVQGVLFDLGVSSHQLNVAERGFSFQADGPLDMRMDPHSAEPDASVLVNTLTERALERILAEWGEERFAGRIARAILRERERAPITTTRQLEQVVWNAVPPGYR